MHSKFRLAASVAAVTCLFCFASSATQATVTLLGIGSLPADAVDLSGLTDPLENGAVQNLLGGIGSSLAYTGFGNRFLVVPDRGPNATPYDPAVDDTTSYIDRFHEIDLKLTASGSGYTVTPTLVHTTLLSSATPLVGKATTDNPNKTYFTGLSSGFDASNSASSMRLDPEGIRIGAGGNSVFISDEYGPHLYEFNRTTGQRIRTLTLPADFNIANPKASGANELPLANTSGRQPNRGMEGLAISPDGKTLVGIMQNPLIQDGALDSVNKRVGTNIRIVTIDAATGATHEYLYQLNSGKNNGVNEIVAVNNHQFLVIERDGNAGTKAAFKKIYEIDIAGATDIKGIAAFPSTGTPAGVIAVSKSVFIDLLDPSFGLAGATFPEKIEGVTFGPDLADGRHTLIVANDNDFLAGQTSNFYVFGVDKGDLNYVSQSIAAVPEPTIYAFFAIGIAVLGVIRLQRRH
ncbi:MAG: esterase-like activity of phytase family protein [Betaproteobacteria bacterium]